MKSSGEVEGATDCVVVSFTLQEISDESGTGAIKGIGDNGSTAVWARVDDVARGTLAAAGGCSTEEPKEVTGRSSEIVSWCESGCTTERGTCIL
jgi:hypothetical protein